MSKPIHDISIANDFSKFPGGRYKADGKNSAEAFRDGILIPALKKDPEAVVRINIDGVCGLPSSFLEEAFGGTVRAMGPDVVSRIEVGSEIGSDSSARYYQKLIAGFMEEAKERAKADTKPNP